MRQSPRHSDILLTPYLLFPIFLLHFLFLFFFFNDPATPEIYTLSLHDALPIARRPAPARRQPRARSRRDGPERRADRKSTRLNSSHVEISYAVFCLKKKKREDPAGVGW